MHAVPINRPPVQFVNLGHGKLQEINGIAGHLIFEDRSVLDDARRNWLKLVELVLEPAHEL